MRLKNLVCAASVVTLAASAVGHTNPIESVAAPDKATAVAAWTPAQQYMMVPNNAHKPKGAPRDAPQEFRSQFAMLVFADEAGDKLSELGRFSVVSSCFTHDEKEHPLLWALCGPDAKALDLKKLESELQAEKIAPDSQKAVLAHVQQEVARVKKIGDKVEAAAKSDPGVAELLKLADAAKSEWTAYVGKNKAAVDRLFSLKAAVRSGKSNHKNFEGCWDATQPAFKKLVAASRFEWDTESYLSAYMTELQKTLDGYITAAAFGACAISIDKTGAILGAVALTGRAGVVRQGWRTLAVAKAIDPSFKPKFAERTMDWSEYGMKRDWLESKYSVDGAGNGDITASLTPHQGEISKVKPDGDYLKLSFKGDARDSCLEWKETKKVQSVGPDGSPVYEKVCKKRGKVDNQEEDVQVHAKFGEGLKPGTSAWLIQGFPVTAWKGKKFVAVFGMPAGPNARK